MCCYLDLRFRLIVTKHTVLLEAKSYTWVDFSCTADRILFESWVELWLHEHLSG